MNWLVFRGVHSLKINLCCFVMFKNVIKLQSSVVKKCLSLMIKGHFTVIEPSKFRNKTMKPSNINALFCHTNTKMSQNLNFQILVHCYKLSYISCDTGITVTEGELKNSCCLNNLVRK